MFCNSILRIPQSGASCYVQAMDAKEIRAANLARYIKERTAGNKAAFSRQFDMNPAHISQLLTRHRDIGDKLAREIERKLNLQRGQMDRLPDSATGRGPLVANESPEVQRLILAFGWLTKEQQAALLSDLESKAETNKAISRQLGPRWEFKSDAHVGNHIKPAPSTKGKKKAAPSRGPDDFMGDFPEK